MINERIRKYMIQDYVEISDNSKYQKYVASGIPLWVYEQDVSKLKVSSDHQKDVDDYFNNVSNNIFDGTHLIIYSERAGSGKSTIQFKIAMKAVDVGFSGVCFYYSDLLALFKECLIDGGMAMAFKRVIQKCDFVVIDNFGEGYSATKEYVVSGMSDLIYYAETGEGHKVPIFISSTIPLSDFTKFMTDSAYHKLQASMNYIEITGGNIRLV